MLNVISIPCPNSPTGAITRQYRVSFDLYGERFVVVPEYGAFTVRHYRSGYELVGGYASDAEAKRAAVDELRKLGPTRLRARVEKLETINTIQEEIDV